MPARRVERLGDELRSSVRGDVFLDPASLGMYSTDASNYQITPRAVVVPRDAEDVRRAVELARQHRMPILPRGGGTSLAGQTVGAALVLDFSKYMNAILELNLEQRRVRVQPGLVRDELNAALAAHGLHFAPDPATSSRANIGGMIGNNSSGTKSILFGKTIDHIEALRVLLADGTELQLGPLRDDQLPEALAGHGRQAQILGRLRALVASHREQIEARTPKVMRRVGGYALDELLENSPWNPAKIFVGSEGTLGVVLEATLRLELLPRYTSVCVVHFHDLMDAIRTVELILAFAPSAVEILDQTVLRLAAGNREAARICDFLEGDPAAVLIVEFYGDTPEQVAQRPQQMVQQLRARELGYAYPVLLDASGQAQVWQVRRSGLGLMLGMKGDRKPLPFIEDAAVPVAVLPQYIERVLAICRELDTEAAMYAHASVGVIHVRPVLDLRRAGDIERMRQIAERTFALVRHYGGAWSGEHGDGLARSPFNERFFGASLYSAFRDLKRLFDPDGLMNPGKIVDAPPMDENLRFGTEYRVRAPQTVYRYRADGSFAAAVEMCSGVGQCRKTGVGTMCPSYMATRDEEDSTRGRANLLRLAMSGQLGDNGIASPRLLRALDLCLSCKACKTECPSNVDMAKLKGEVLQQAHDRRGLRLRERLVRDSGPLARRLAGPGAPLVNRAQQSRLVRRLLQHVVGIDARRVLPTYARFPFRPRPEQPLRSAAGRQVALFVDTYLECHEPHVGHAALQLLRACGYRVNVARLGCCQRPRISGGFLRRARREGETTLRRLDALVSRGIPVLVCEPSCASALTDDLPDLVRDSDLGDRIAAGVWMIDVFLDREIAAGRLRCDLELQTQAAARGPDVLVHGHCHQKALYGTEAMLRLLGRAMDARVTEVDSGCCGMAGAFGYEREHYEISRRIGEDRLFPAIRALESSGSIVACGFSCRHQIRHFTGRTARHWIETVRVRAAAR